MTRPWYEDPTSIAELAHWLDDRGDLPKVSDALHLVEKPWHYEDAWQQMLAEQMTEVAA